MYQRLSGHQTHVVANAKEYLTNRVRLRLAGGWLVGLHELVLDLVALFLDKFLSSECENFGRHFDRRWRGQRNLRWLVGWLVCWLSGWLVTSQQ